MPVVTEPGAAARPTIAARVAAGLSGDGAFYALLTLLVWGATAPLAGLWQDDTSLLFIALQRHGRGLAVLLAPTGSPLRRLSDLPYAVALATPHPVWALQGMSGALWVGQALVAGWIAGLLLPRRPLARLLVVALTLTATSDYLTDNLTAVGYNFGVLTFLVSLGSGLRFLRCGGVGWLAAAAAALAVSLLTLEVCMPALPFLPLLVVWVAGLRPRRRTVGLLLAWGVVAAPLMLIEWRFLHDPKGYAAVAMLPMSRAQIVDRAVDLWSANFLPWRWAFRPEVWFARPPAVIPAALMAVAAVVAVAALALRVRDALGAAACAEPRPASAARVLGLAALLALMALAANGAFAQLQMAEIHYRTHVLSRIWVSIALGGVAAWGAARWPRWRLAVLVVPALFVGFGTWGGLERQDLWLATWRQHRRELLSIVSAAPAVRMDTAIILRSDPLPTSYLATQVDYLAHGWMALLYNQQGIDTLRLDARLGTGCRPMADGLDCWHMGKAECFAAQTCPPDHIAFDHLLVFDFDAAAGVYRLRQSLIGDPLAAGAAAPAAAASYRPAARIVERALTTAQRRLLLLP
jgi:hypothetical protein